MWEIIGKLCVSYVAVRIAWCIIKGLYGSFLGAILGLNADLKRMGKWAVVTGATDGIGKAYAVELARQGLNVFLISRNPYKLQNVAAEIEEKYDVETKILDVDFTHVDIYDKIRLTLQGLDIGILVNNVGMSYMYPEFFSKIPHGSQFINDLLACNIHSVAFMTWIVLPGMEERKQGLIINISSVSSTIPAPFLALYGASKSFVLSFSKSLSLEVKNKGIMVQCLFPGFVVSNMSKIRTPTIMAPTPKDYVIAAFKTTGIEEATAGYYAHKLQVFGTELMMNYLPGFVTNLIVFCSLDGLRLKAMRKLEKNNKTE